MKFKIILIAVLIIACFGCATKKIDYNSLMEDTGAVELDADFNGAVDVDKGGTNVQAYNDLKTALSIDEVDNTSDANKPVSTLTQTGLDNKEDDLGNPAVNGFVLSSTIAGFRSWIDISGISVVWGTIGGTLAAQTDLQNEFDLKQNLLTFGISDGNSIIVDSASVGSGEYAIFTPLGLQSFSIAQVKSNLNLENLDNTSDLNKPISTLTQAEIDTKEDTLPAASEDVSFLTSLISGVRSFLTITETKTALSIENVDNTADIDKVISTLQQNALDLKLDISSAFDPDSPGELGATVPAKGNFTEIEIPFDDGNAGIFWDQANTLQPSDVYGIYPYNGNMYKIENSVHSLMNAGGSGTAIVEVADTPEGWEMIPGTLYIAQDDGELSFLLADSSEVFRYASTSSTALFDMTLTVAETDGSTVDINGTSYGNGGPYTISALTGSTAMDISYVTADTTVWTGADSGDVTGTTPNFFIDMTSADKTLIATISPTTGVTKWIGFPNTTGTPSAPVGSWTDHATGGGVDRVYASRWTATEDGTVESISFRTGTGALDNSGADAWVTVYNGTTLIGFAVVGAQSTEAWTSYITVVVAGGQSLDYSTSDELNFWVTYDDQVLSNALSSDSGGEAGVIFFDNTTAVTGTPPTSVTWVSSAVVGPAVIMRVITR